MRYIKRQMEEKLIKAFKTYKVVLVTGARQVGKTRLIKELFSKIKYINFDNQFFEDLATADGLLFLNNNGFPLILDEVQYVPSLFRYLKYKCDEIDSYSLYILSGSQILRLLDDVSNTLAGRIHILELAPLSLREIMGSTFNQHFLPTADYLSERKKTINKIFSSADIWKILHRGFYPELQDKNKQRMEFYSDYVKTYIERDVREILKVKDLQDFKRFLVAIAARTGEILNYAHIANEIAKDAKTIKEWVSVLEATGIIYLLRPYENTYLKRVIKSPKLYFRDTGLCAYLTRWDTSESLMNGAMNGHFFETFVVSELLKSFSNAGYDYSQYVFYYNGKDGKKREQQEIDFIIEKNGKIYPIEIKMTTKPSLDMVKGFEILDKVKDKAFDKGCIICPIDDVTAISDKVVAIPIEYL